MRERVSAEQKMRMIGMVPCVTAFPAWLAGKVCGEFLRPLIHPGVLFRMDCAASIGCLPSLAICSSSGGQDWRARTAAPRFASISLEHSPCRR